MGRRRITVDQLGEAIDEILKDYANDVYNAQSKVITASTKQALREVRANSGHFGHKYAYGWRSKVERGNIYSTGYCYNGRPGLPHLLEFGHALTQTKRAGKKTRTDEYPHVAPAQDAVDMVLMQHMTEELEEL